MMKYIVMSKPTRLSVLRRRVRLGRVVGLLTMMVAGLIIGAGPSPSYANLSENPDNEPCEPNPIDDGLCDEGPREPSNEQRIAVGRDRDLAAAQAEAEDEAETICFRSFEVLAFDVDINPGRPYRYTLTYSCR